jgi:hypothetical protein
MYSVALAGAAAVILARQTPIVAVGSDPVVKASAAVEP